MDYRLALEGTSFHQIGCFHYVEHLFVTLHVHLGVQ